MQAKDGAESAQSTGKIEKSLKRLFEHLTSEGKKMKESPPCGEFFGGKTPTRYARCRFAPPEK